jgi:pimeloyl-ACP methyl ester carboxylesterase
MRFILVSLISFLFSAAASAGVTDQLVDLAKPNGTNLRYLLTTDSKTPAPAIGVILFAGGQGAINLDKGVPGFNGNFLVRTRQMFAQHGLAVAVYDPSSDLGPMSDAARMSQPHADEVAQVLADFKRKTGVKQVYLVGTSRGTISAAYLATVFNGEVSGVVLTSTVFQASKGSTGLSRFDFSTISQPLLFVHHVADACKTTSPGYASALASKYPVIWVEGVEGDLEEPCGHHSAHGYLGREAATVRAIAEWILQRKFVPKVAGIPVRDLALKLAYNAS